ncbi:MAG TPA: glycosyltransferase family 87 protein [Candidatus Limnocylindrales bacterium]
MTAVLRPLPLRIAGRRFWLWSVGLAVASAILIVGAPFNRFVDFPQFWFAGKLVGSPDLLDPARQTVWELAHGFTPWQFLYPPGTAWLYSPLGFMPMAAAFLVHAVVIALAGAAAGFVGARTYGLDSAIGIIAALAWTPVLAAAACGQNAPLALMLAIVAIDCLRRDRRVLAGLAVGAMFYKPTLALPMFALLVLRRQWMSLFVAMVVAVGWYLLGVAGSAGDWMWPTDWLSLTSGYFAQDIYQNVNKTVALPGLMMGHGIPSPIAYAAAVAVAVAALPRLLRAPIAEAGAGACLIGIVVSPHSLQYEAAMVLPILLWAAGGNGSGLAEPWRTRLLVGVFVLAQMYVITPFLGVSVFAAVTFGATAIWITGWKRQDAGPDEARTAAPPAEASTS